MNCVGCHGAEGQGERGPQLANSSFIMDNRELAVALILRGNQVNPPTVDSVWVNGVLHLAGDMPEHGSFLSNHEVAGLITFIRSVWNDTLVTNCDPNNVDANNAPICVRTPRTAAEMDLDSVAVWEVKAIRDTLPPVVE
jgi:mono/diheme cytochrome c family protein